MKVLVIGNDGATHAVAWKLSQSPAVRDLYSAPGNYGTNLVGANLDLPVSAPEELAAWAKEQQIDLTVVTSSTALAYGVVDAFRELDLRIVGPSRAAARLGTSRIWAREFLARHYVPAVPAIVCTEIGEAASYVRGLPPEAFPLLLTTETSHDRPSTAHAAPVLALDAETALATVQRVLAPDRHGTVPQIVIETYADDFSLSLLAITDGVTTLPFGAAHCYRRAFDADQGPLVAGMGAYSPVPSIDDEQIERGMDRIIRPILAGLAAEGLGYRGILSVEVALGSSGMQVRDIHTTFGDLEAQVLLPRFEDDLYIALDAAFDAALGELRPFRWSQNVTCGMVLASEGYPGEFETGYGVLGAGDIPSGTQVFHLNTRNPYRRSAAAGVSPKLERASRGAIGRGFSSWFMPSRGRSRKVDAQASQASGDPYSQIITAGGPVLMVVGSGRTLAEARTAAYRGLEPIAFTGCWARQDIGVLDQGVPEART
ncbi:MAG TPA: phosphoribosylglycinamide synthetase C domain-containing protein [Chloroflexota bacterium]|nr:phosphoribosylglycinamide synthetase C domain-containing protein [Chloroflexota bacterium]